MVRAHPLVSSSVVAMPYPSRTVASEAVTPRVAASPLAASPLAASPLAAPAGPATSRGVGPALPAHFYGLDALRGVAALAVVFWHWQHFFLGRNAEHVAGFDFSREPLYAVFAPLYTDGWRAVELFFTMSGFIFAWLYAAPIREGRVTARAFALLRVSRLYPLHLATLLFVAVAQWLVTRGTGMPFVYLWNDAYHFALHLVFANSWGLERGETFNGPTWSVSVEVLLYGLFFLTCRLGVRRWWQLAGVAAAGYALTAWASEVNNGIARVGTGILCFYVGAIVFVAYRALWSRQPSRGARRGLAAATIAAWAFVPLNFSDRLVPLWRLAGPHPLVTVAGHDVVLAGLWRVAGRGRYGFELLVFPLTILTLALWESARGPIGRRLRVLGDISYASYLVHFPLQLVVFGGAMALGLSRSVFYQPAALLGFFAALIPLSVATYRGFEMPAQRWMRARLLGAAARPRDRERADESGEQPARKRPAVAA